MTITNETEYRNAFRHFDQLIADLGDDPEKQALAQTLAEHIQAYEQEAMPFPQPTTVAGMVELKMYELRLKSSDLAKLLGVTSSWVDQFINGTQPLDFELAKKLHEKLGIDGDFMLEVA